MRTKTRRMMKLCAALALALTLLANAAALAEVRVTGDANLRMGAGLDCDVFDSVSEGSSLPYLNQTMTDERGVDWYLVDYKGTPLWISSKYAELVDTGDFTEYDREAAQSFIDVSQYYLEMLEDTAETLGLTNYREVTSDAPYQYYNDMLTIGGYGMVEYMELYGPGYSIYGASIGMDHDSAKQALIRAGMTVTDDSGDNVIFDHPAGERSLVSIDGADSCIILDCVNGVVATITWSTYTS